MSYDSWKLATPPEYDDAYFGEAPQGADEGFYDYIDRLEELAETREQEAHIERLIRAYENEHGPRFDGWEHVEFPFAENH